MSAETPLLRPSDAPARIAGAARQYAALELLVLFGSRARGDPHEASDWDLGYMAGAGFDADGLYAELTRLLGTEHVDLVDLERADASLRFAAAREGWLLLGDEARFEDFVEEAAQFWCDMGPVVRRAWDDVLADLG